MERQSQRLLEELEQWKSRAAKVTRAFSGAPGGSSSDPMPECVGKIMELEEALNRQIDQMVDQRKIIEKAIGAVPQTLQREVLSLRYIKGESWEEIGEKLHYGVQHVHRLHGWALKTVQMPKDAIECDCQPMV